MTIFEALFPGLVGSTKPWKLVNLNEAFRNSEKNLNMRDVYDQNRLLEQVAEKGTYRTYGGFAEERIDLWRGFEHGVEKMVHLGVDFNNLPPEEPVCAVAAGQVIHVMVDESPFNGWGGRVMIQDEKYVYLYGHLVAEAENLPTVGDAKIQKGDVIGYVGAPEENGGWFPHLHLQIMTRAYVKPYEKDLARLDGVIDPLVWWREANVAHNT